MTKRSEIFSIRTVLPVGLGVAIGIAVGAVALANVPIAKGAKGPVVATVSVAAEPQASAIKPLSAAPGIRFARASKDGELCFLARQTHDTEMFCTH